MLVYHQILKAAHELGCDRVLCDPLDNEVVVAAVELALGDWPEGLEVDRSFETQIIREYDRGDHSSRIVVL
jgi:hypothetical protein